MVSSGLVGSEMCIRDRYMTLRQASMLRAMTAKVRFCAAILRDFVGTLHAT